MLHGVNINLLGARQTEIYGDWSLEKIDGALCELGEELSLNVRTFQTNDEGRYIEMIQSAPDQADFLILNPGAWTHTSIAIRDALLACGLPALEIHLSNIEAREPFRHTSHIADVVIGRVAGLGPQGYLAALRFAREFLKNQPA